MTSRCQGLFPPRPQSKPGKSPWERSCATLPFRSFTKLDTKYAMTTGAIIRDGDRKRAISSIGVGSMTWDNISIFRTNCAIACGTRVYIAARIFADVAHGKWRQNLPKSFMLLAHNSRPLWQLEFCLSIFAVSCSSLSEDSAEFRYVPLYIADQVEFRCSFSQELHITPI